MSVSQTIELNFIESNTTMAFWVGAGDILKQCVCVRVCYLSSGVVL